jgi:hypothetical protein
VCVCVFSKTKRVRHYAKEEEDMQKFEKKNKINEQSTTKKING